MLVTRQQIPLNLELFKRLSVAQDFILGSTFDKLVHTQFTHLGFSGYCLAYPTHIDPPNRSEESGRDKFPFRSPDRINLVQLREKFGTDKAPVFIPETSQIETWALNHQNPIHDTDVHVQGCGVKAAVPTDYSRRPLVGLSFSLCPPFVKQREAFSRDYITVEGEPLMTGFACALGGPTLLKQSLARRKGTGSPNQRHHLR
jgi:hypothetical protein